MIWWTCFALVCAVLLGFPVVAALHVRWLMRLEHIAEPVYMLGRRGVQLRLRYNWEEFYP